MTLSHPPIPYPTYSVCKYFYCQADISTGYSSKELRMQAFCKAVGIRRNFSILPLSTRPLTVRDCPTPVKPPDFDFDRPAAGWISGHLQRGSRAPVLHGFRDGSSPTAPGDVLTCFPRLPPGQPVAGLPRAGGGASHEAPKAGQRPPAWPVVSGSPSC